MCFGIQQLSVKVQRGLLGNRGSCGICRRGSILDLYSFGSMCRFIMRSVVEVSSELYVEQTHSANNNHAPAWRYGGETLIYRHPISADGKIANHVAKEKERVIIANPSIFQIVQCRCVWLSMEKNEYE